MSKHPVSAFWVKVNYSIQPLSLEFYYFMNTIVMQHC